jgi:hypothetical protein
MRAQHLGASSYTIVGAIGGFTARMTMSLMQCLNHDHIGASALVPTMNEHLI